MTLNMMNMMNMKETLMDTYLLTKLLTCTVL